MPIKSIKFQGSWQGKWQDAQTDIHRNYTGTAMVTVTEKATSLDVLAEPHPYMPGYGRWLKTYHYEDLDAYLKNLTIRQVGPKVFQLDCEWDTEASREPLDWRKPRDPVATKQWVRYSKTGIEDWHPVWDQDGEMIGNSAGCPYDNPINVRKPYSIIHIERAVWIFDWLHSSEWTDAVNDSPWAGQETGEWRCLVREGREIIENGLAYVWETIEIAYKPGGWEERRIDAGPFYLVTRDGKKVRCDVRTDPAGARVSGPFLLDGKGGLLPDDIEFVDGKPVRQYPVVTRLHRIRKTKNFRELQIE